MEYLIVLPVSFFRTSDGRVACESAFLAHLRQMRQQLHPRFSCIRIATPIMAEAEYSAHEHQLGHFDERAESIFYQALFPETWGRPRFLLYWPLLCWHLLALIRRAGLVHSGISMDLWRPFEFTAILMGVMLRRKTLFMMDIDERRSDEMLYLTGKLSRRRYLLSRYLYQPLRNLQLYLAVRICSLVMLKSAHLVADFGRGRSWVKNFYDVAYSTEHIIAPAQLASKQVALAQHDLPLRCIYFGRLVAYKGVDHCIQAVHEAAVMGAKVEFLILGAGPEAESLQALIKALGAEAYIRLQPPLPYGRMLFELLYDQHLLLAAPLAQDTPRSLFDAMAAGVPTLAYDTDYYQDLTRTGAVITVPWLDHARMARQLNVFAADKTQLAAGITSGVEFAKENSQQYWLRKRMAWFDALFSDETVLDGTND